MGLCHLGNGSSSPPNLSPLAPPFTVDRSNPKPNSNPLVNFSEPPYAVPFHSPFPNWQYSKPDSQSKFGSEIDSIRTTCLSSANDYPYLASEPVSSPSSHLPPLNLNGDAGSDHVEAKPFCAPFVDILSVALNEPSYDLLSTSRVSPLEGYVQVGYTQSLSASEYELGSFWNRLADREQGKPVEIDDGLCSEETNIGGSYIYKNYMEQAACAAEGLSKCDEAFAVSLTKYVDVLGSKSQIVSPSTEKTNDKSSPLQGPRFSGNEPSRASISASSTLPESKVQGPYPEPAANFWNQQKPYWTSHERYFQPLDSCIDGGISVKKSSPALVIKPPSGGASSTVANIVSSEDENTIGNVATVNRNTLHGRSNQKEPRLSPSYDKEGCFDTSRPNLDVKRSDHFSVASSSIRKEELVNKPITKDVSDSISISKAGMEFHFPDNKVCDGFTLGLDRAKSFSSAEDSSATLDHCNPAVDSPCWKGNPASRLSLSEISEILAHQHLMKKLEAHNNLNHAQTQVNPTYIDDDLKVYEDNGYVELGSLLCPKRLSNASFPTRESSFADVVKTGLDCPKLSSSNRVQFSNDIGKPRKDYNMPNDSKSDPKLKAALAIQLGLDKDEFLSERVSKLFTRVVADIGLDISDTLEDGSVPTHGKESTSCLPCSAEDGNEVPNLHATESSQKINFQMLVNTMHNLSEVLLFHCSSDDSAVSEQDIEAIKNAINNLDACVLESLAHAIPKQESMVPLKDTAHQRRKSPDLHKGVTVGRPPVTKEVDAPSHGRLDYNCMVSPGKEAEKFANCVALGNHAEIMKDDDTVQAVKKLLEEDFNVEGEMQSETLLYKNLWLEAEAALCSVSYKDRFNRMKIKMEKSKSHDTKVVAETTKVVEKLPSSKVSLAPITHKVASPVKDSSKPENPIEDSSISNPTRNVDDAQASVMARFDILKRRVQSSNTINTEEQHLTESVDAGFSGVRNHWSFVGDHSDDASFIQADKCRSNTKCSEQKTVKQFGGNRRIGTRLSLGWYDSSSSSEWEHIL